MPTNLSKNKYSIITKKQNSKQKPNSSNTKNKVLIRSIYTTNRKQNIINKDNNNSHIKSSLIQ